MDRKLLAEAQGLVGSLRKSGSSLCYPHGLQWEKGLDVLASLINGEAEAQRRG